jgi:hypothetical protein
VGHLEKPSQFNGFVQVKDFCFIHRHYRKGRLAFPVQNQRNYHLTPSFLQPISGTFPDIIETCPCLGKIFYKYLLTKDKLTLIFRSKSFYFISDKLSVFIL